MNYMFSGCKNLKYINLNNFREIANLTFESIFDDVPENIVFCINENKTLYSLLSQKVCSNLDCSGLWTQKTDIILFKENNCILNCKDYSNKKYFCSDFCPNKPHIDSFKCEVCYPSCFMRNM